MQIALAVSALLTIAGLAAFWYASGIARKAPPKATGNAVTVTIKGKVCDPNDITIPAGRTTFTIVNQSERALEWEILDGVMVVEERENIAPGFSQTMSAVLKPGTYAITCGLLSNPRGKLVVTPSAASAAEEAKPSLVQYVGPLAEYKVFLVLESDTLEESTRALVEAIKAGDVSKAQELYATAHQSYKRIEPMADMFADLDTRLNARADYFEKREKDPSFRGFHLIEYHLFSLKTTKDLATPADQLLADVETLKTRLNTLSIPPERLSILAAKLLQRLADNLQAGGEEHYSNNDVSNLQGSLEGTQKIAELIAPLLTKAAPSLQTSIDQDFAAFDAALAPYRQNGEIKSVALDQEKRIAFVAPLHALAVDLGKVNAALGLE